MDRGDSSVKCLLNSTNNPKVVDSNLVHNILDGNGVKAMQESIPSPNFGSIWKYRQNIGSQMAHTNKNFL